jgi:hypothetical protein
MTLIRVRFASPVVTDELSLTISLRPMDRSMSRSAYTAPKYFCTPSKADNGREITSRRHCVSSPEPSRIGAR